MQCGKGGVPGDGLAHVLGKLIYPGPSRPEVVFSPAHAVFRDVHLVRPADVIAGLPEEEGEALRLPRTGGEASCSIESRKTCSVKKVFKRLKTGQRCYTCL